MRYVNDKYQQHYKNIERQKRYNQDKKDYSWVLMIGFLSLWLCFLILFLMATTICVNNEEIRNENKFIEIERNSLGCVKYRYNRDIIWKCPKEQQINTIEREVCTSGKNRTCTTHHDPVIDK